MKIQSYSETRANLKQAIATVLSDSVPIVITSKAADVVLVSRVDFESMQETLHLLSSRKNAERLQESIKQVESL